MSRNKTQYQEDMLYMVILYCIFICVLHIVLHIFQIKERVKTKKPDNLLIIRLLNRASSRDQTNDLLITSQLLYQLSYGGNLF